MRPEFPVDKWLRRHMIPMLIVLFVYFWFAASSHGCVEMLFAPGAGMFGVLIWQFWWDWKYPRVVEFCKECGRAKPERFVDQ